MKEIIIKTTPDFDRKAYKLMTEEAIEALFDYLLLYPEQDKIMSETDGLRNLRWPSGLNYKDKSGGIRVIYHYSDDLLIVAIAVYAKSDKENLTQKGFVNQFQNRFYIKRQLHDRFCMGSSTKVC